MRTIWVYKEVDGSAMTFDVLAPRQSSADRPTWAGAPSARIEQGGWFATEDALRAAVVGVRDRLQRAGHTVTVDGPMSAVIGG